MLRSGWTFRLACGTAALPGKTGDSQPAAALTDVFHPPPVRK